MANNQPIPKHLKSDHLFLLVGENPLPNYVAGLLLSGMGCTVYLLHSTGESINKGKTILSTKRIAEFIRTALEDRREDLNVVLRGISEVDSKEISAQMKQIIEEEKPSDRNRIGLNYTGGRKPMAIHAYQTLDRILDNVVFSYLDANHLTIRFDGIPNPYSVSEGIEIKLQELAFLHGYELTNLSKTTRFPEIIHTIAEIHSTKQGIKQWKLWLQKSKAKHLPSRKQFPAISPFLDRLDQLCSGDIPQGWLAQKLGFSDLRSCFNWLQGGWLEELSLHAIIENRTKHSIKIHDYGISLKPEPSASLNLNTPKNFELDVAAMIGYQLFAVSCISSKKEGGETKKHLFEAYTRARQLGGDEARVALVCLVDNPHALLDEIKREWHTSNQIQVFGRKHLTGLTQAFWNWFRTAN